MYILLLLEYVYACVPHGYAHHARFGVTEMQLELACLQDSSSFFFLPLSLLSHFYLCDPMISPNEPESDKVLFFNFNQDYSCVSIGTTSGYQMYNCDPFGQCHSQGKHFILLSLGVSLTSLKTGNAGTSIAEMLFSTSLVALVGVGTCPEFNSRDLHIINTKVSIG